MLVDDAVHDIRVLDLLMGGNTLLSGLRLLGPIATVVLLFAIADRIDLDALAPRGRTS